MVQRFGVPNVFLDTTVLPSDRFPTATVDSVTKDVLAAAHGGDWVFVAAGE
jgi:hypothetical protein